MIFLRMTWGLETDVDADADAHHNLIITIVQWPGSGAAGAPSLPSTSIISKTRSKSSARTTTSKSSSALSGDYHDDQYDHDLMAIDDQYDHDLTANFPCTGLWSVHSSPAKPLKPVEWGSREASWTEATPQEKVSVMRLVVLVLGLVVVVVLVNGDNPKEDLWRWETWGYVLGKSNLLGDVWRDPSSKFSNLPELFTSYCFAGSESLILTCLAQ